MRHVHDRVLSAFRPLVFVAAAVSVGCEQQNTLERPARTETPREADARPQREPVAPAPLRRRVVVLAASSPPGPQAVEQAVSHALQQRGFEPLPGDRAAHADLIVAVWSATRPTDAWGGMPTRQVMLRCVVLDPVQRTPLHRDVDSGGYADSTDQAAMLGALRKAADNLARRLAARVARMGPPAPAPPPVVEPAAEPVVPLAVVPFRNATNRADLSGWCESLASIAAQEFARAKKYRIVERARLGEVLKDADVAAAMGADAGAIRRMGEQLGVELLLVGEVAVRPDGELAISARLVDARTAEVRRIIHAAGPAAAVDALEQAFRCQLQAPRDTWILQQLDQLGQAPVVWPDAGPRR